MTSQTSDRDRTVNHGPLLHVVVATHSREVKTALFHSLNATPTVTIVATGTSTVGLVKGSHASAPRLSLSRPVSPACR
jgi:hypothetical protein